MEKDDDRYTTEWENERARERKKRQLFLFLSFCVLFNLREEYDGLTLTNVRWRNELFLQGKCQPFVVDKTNNQNLWVEKKNQQCWMTLFLIENKDALCCRGNVKSWELWILTDGSSDSHPDLVLWFKNPTAANLELKF
jgi:hypothetical protein